MLDGTITNAKFEKLVTKGLEDYATLIGSESTDIADICEIKYVHDEANNPFFDPEVFWEDFTDSYGFEVVEDFWTPRSFDICYSFLTKDILEKICFLPSIFAHLLYYANLDRLKSSLTAYIIPSNHQNTSHFN